MNLKKIFPFILVVLLALITLAVRRCSSSNPGTQKKINPSSRENKTDFKRGLNRNPSHINYTEHAKCRMQCRHITESEVKDMLANGAINYKKSELQGTDCKKKYAVEGNSKDGQRLRIIFAPCADEVTVVTCIDVKEEWDCPDCK
ncbi:MAG: DUF4258 domain-containing protein [Ferruginibacter sp.]